MTSFQKIIKYLSLGFAAFLIITIFYGISFAIRMLANINNNDSSLPKELIKFEELDKNSNALYAKINVSDLIIKKGDKLTVETDNKNINVKQDLNKISIEEKSHFDFFNSNKSKVIVYVPTNFKFDDVFIEVGAGTMEADYINTSKLNLKIGAGTITLDEIYSTTSSNIETGAGEVVIKKSEFNDLSLDCGIGQITLNTKLTGNNDINGGIGEININFSDSKDNYKISAKKGIGDLRLDGSSINESESIGNGGTFVKVNGGIGEINIKFNR